MHPVWSLVRLLLNTAFRHTTRVSALFSALLSVSFSTLFSTFLILWATPVVAEIPEFSQISVKGSIAGAPLKTLSQTEFLTLQIRPQQATRSWLGLVSSLSSSQLIVHIIDPEFYSDERKLGFRSTFGTHEAYARYHGLARNSADFIQKVSATGQQKQLMPFTLHLPPANSNIGGKPINWVFQNRRYHYRDSSDHFAKVLINSQRAVQQQLFADRGDSFRAAFITYNKPGRRRPNLATATGKRDINALSAAGYTVISEAELDSLSGLAEQQVYVMNTGTAAASGNYEAHGFLRHITDLSATGSGANNINDLTPRDIALFDALPERIPPVAGIIVLEKQTALSHVNILAKNRGTLNISLNSTTPGLASNDPAFLAAVISGFKTELMDKPVKFTVTKQQQLSISSSSTAEVGAFLARQKASREPVDIVRPVIVDTARWLLNPAQEGLGVHQVGAKAANYGLIQNWLAGDDLVLPGRAIGFNLYLQTITIAGEQGKPVERIAALLAAKDTLSQAAINQELQGIRGAINAIPLAKAPSNAAGRSVAQEIGALFGGDYSRVGRIRLRSSTNCEDLPAFNGAGLYESKGFTAMKTDANGQRILDEQKLWRRLKQVMASLWLPRAFHEREYFGIDHHKAAMAIQINPAFSDKWLSGVKMHEWGNGVAVYAEQNGQRRLVVNAQFGEAAVTNPLPGELPESFVMLNGKLNKVSSRARIGDKQHELFIAAGHDEIITTERTLLNKLAQGVQTIFRHKIRQNPDPVFRDPQRFGIDIEFKLMFDEVAGVKRLFIKQARPLLLKEF